MSREYANELAFGVAQIGLPANLEKSFAWVLDGRK